MPGKSVVVVGGGGAGARLAASLSRSSAFSPSTGNTLTLVTARPFWPYLIAGARFTSSREGNFAEKCLVPYDKFFDNGCGKVKVGRVVKVEPHLGGDGGKDTDGEVNDQGSSNEGGELVLESGERVKYDLLVLSPGSTWTGPLAFPDSKEETMQHLDKWWTKFENAKAVVLVGGGAVGVEYAGELKEFYPSMKVTIVHSRSMLLNDAYSEKFRRRLEREIRDRGIEIVFEDRVDELVPPDNGNITTRKGQVIECDLAVPTYGCRPATDFLTTLEPNILNSHGEIKVNPRLQVADPSLSNIYAMGNAIDWKEEKQARKYGKHIRVIYTNILSQLAGKAPSRVYKGCREHIWISIGKNGGVAFSQLFWGWTIIMGNWFVSRANGATMRVERVWRLFGQSMPA